MFKTILNGYTRSAVVALLVAAGGLITSFTAQAKEFQPEVRSSLTPIVQVGQPASQILENQVKADGGSIIQLDQNAGGLENINPDVRSPQLTPPPPGSSASFDEPLPDPRLDLRANRTEARTDTRTPGEQANDAFQGVANNIYQFGSDVDQGLRNNLGNGFGGTLGSIAELGTSLTGGTAELTGYLAENITDLGVNIYNFIPTRGQVNNFLGLGEEQTETQVATNPAPQQPQQTVAEAQTPAQQIPEQPVADNTQQTEEKSFSDNMAEFMGNATGAVVDTANAVAGAATGAVNFVGDLANDAYNGITGLFRSSDKPAEEQVAATTPAPEQPQQTVAEAQTPAQQIPEQPVADNTQQTEEKSFSDNMAEFMGNATGTVVDTANAVAGAATGAVNFVGGLANDAYNGITGLFRSSDKPAEEQVAATNPAPEQPQQTVDEVQTPNAPAQSVADNTQQTEEKSFSDNMAEFMGNATGTVVDTANAVAGAATDAAKFVGGLAGDAYNGVTGLFKSSEKPEVKKVTISIEKRDQQQEQIDDNKPRALTALERGEITEREATYLQERYKYANVDADTLQPEQKKSFSDNMADVMGTATGSVVKTVNAVADATSDAAKFVAGGVGTVVDGAINVGDAIGENITKVIHGVRTTFVTKKPAEEQVAATTPAPEQPQQTVDEAQTPNAPAQQVADNIQQTEEKSFSDNMADVMGTATGAVVDAANAVAGAATGAVNFVGDLASDAYNGITGLFKSSDKTDKPELTQDQKIREDMLAQGYSDEQIEMALMHAEMFNETEAPNTEISPTIKELTDGYPQNKENFGEVFARHNDEFTQKIDKGVKDVVGENWGEIIGAVPNTVSKVVSAGSRIIGNGTDMTVDGLTTAANATGNFITKDIPEAFNTIIPSQEQVAKFFGVNKKKPEEVAEVQKETVKPVSELEKFLTEKGLSPADIQTALSLVNAGTVKTEQKQVEQTTSSMKNTLTTSQEGADKGVKENIRDEVNQYTLTGKDTSNIVLTVNGMTGR